MSKYIAGINEENFDAFLTALRSGDYKQGHHKLESRDGSFCCLGVVSNLASEAGAVERKELDYGGIFYDTSSGALSLRVADWIGLPKSHRVHGETSCDVPFFKQGFDNNDDDKRVHTAIGWNDSLGKSFAEIADAFEAEFRLPYVEGVNTEALDKFLSALESGQYKQGTHRLHERSTNAMCCLGVATAVLGPECGVRLVDREENRSSRTYIDACGTRFTLLMPPSVTEFLGIPRTFVNGNAAGDTILVDKMDTDTWEGDEEEYDPYLRDGRELISVVQLNDKGVPFATIAKRIRETLTVKEV